MRSCFLFLFSFFSLLLFGQERCAQVPYEKMIHSTVQNEARFEQWMKYKISFKNKSPKNERTQSGPYIIPVVVHVIHNGEAVGTGTNISDAQIQSQIDVLNQDYQRLNADASSTQSDFVPVAGSMDIQFVLAKQDPEGQATTGITRVKGTKTGWNLSDASTFKSLSYWRADRYLNIWVINFTDPGGYIGYAQLPVATGTTLQGLEDASTDSLTDGVTIHYTTFGSNDDGNFNLDSHYNKGRTATHEVGHFLGLRHIWGDVSSCASTDYVDDTPVQDAATRTCPTTAQQSCSHNKMYQNYMDYTDDACMNLFTAKQVERMDIVINNCIRRKSLLTSPGASEPVPVANDLGIKSIITPQANACFGPNTPSIEIKNYGSNTITTCRVQLKIAGSIIETKDFNTSLAPLASVNVAFTSVVLSSATSQNISFEVLQVNGVTDANANNNLLQLNITTPSAGSLPFSETFNATPADWIIQNPDGLRTWEMISLSTGQAMRLNFYDYENEGAVDRLISPVFDLSNATEASLRFDYAYAQYPGENDDSLYVLVLTDCAANLSSAAKVFSKNGSTLSTTTSTSNSFTPTSSQWQTATISLQQYIGQSNVQIAFVAVNGYGNNLYLDNVFVLNQSITDVALTGLASPGPVSCSTSIQPVIKVQNQGSETVTSFTVETAVNSSATVTQSFTSIQLLPGDEKDFTLNTVILNSGLNQFAFTLKNPNGGIDDVSSNDGATFTSVVNQSADIIPLRENFDTDFSAWSIASPNSTLSWATATTNFSTSLVCRDFNNTNIGQQAWLVSPVLDFSQTSKAGLIFNASYATRSTGTEQFQLLVSTDCGLTYPTILYDRQASQFATGSSTSAWLPQTTDDWLKDFINLNSIAGLDNIRLAFVVTNQNGNYFYLDNLSFYADDDASPPQVNAPYYIYATSATHEEYNITFNLDERTDVGLQIYNLLGQKVAEYTLPNTLNQTYPLDFTEKGTGIFIVKTKVGNQVNGTRILVSR